MAPKPGDTVRVHYRGTKSDGEEFDSSAGREPLEFVFDSGEVIPGFNSAVIGLEAGDKVTVTVSPDDAYGERYEEAKHTFPMDSFPSQPEIGWVLELGGPNGERIPAIVSEITDEGVVLDLNHPLAGEALTFEIEVVEIVEA